MENLRKEIDLIDDEMQSLFIKRLEIVKKIALEKKNQGLEILNQDREQEILTRLTNKIDDKYISGLYPKFIVNVMEISKIYQELLMKE
ncbi:MAG: chorismate mutase [Candidatus Izemoplasmatales bacterium]|nr:chorismate mutase [Candidatus Izemoplasmatales bacterium]